MILYAIASRDPATAKKAAKKYRFQKAYGAYQDLLDDPAVDIVYVSTPNALHFEWAAHALRAGKHVLCEKPFTANADEARRLVQLAQEKGLICEEAVNILTQNAYSNFELILFSSFIGNFIRPRICSVTFWSLANTAGFCERMPS